MIGIFKRLWTKFAGSPKNFSMEIRAFNAMSVISFIILIGLAFFNFTIDMPGLAYVLFGTSAIVCVLYYLSRFRKKLNLPVIVFIICSYGLMGGSFFMNSGIHGPIMYMLCLTLMMITVIAPIRQHWFWVPIHALFGGFLLLVNYLHPEWIPFTYESRVAQYTDLFICYTVTIVFIYVVSTFLRLNYMSEKTRAETKADALFKSNETISEQNRELTTLNIEKDRLFSIIAHDLRNPLSSIQGFLQIINDPSISAEERTLIERELLDLARNTYDLLNNLLHWSGQQVRGKQPQPEQIDLREPVAETLALLRPLAVAKNIHIHNECKESHYIYADLDMLQIVIRNILNNAIKFTPNNGHIYLSCKNLGENHYFNIRDTGIGIPRPKQRQLFTLGGKSTRGTNAESGIGLGLILCYDFMKAMNGEISFVSEPGEGAEFILRFPAMSMSDVT